METDITLPSQPLEISFACCDEVTRAGKKKTVGTPSSPSARSAVCLTAPAVKFIHLVEPGCIIDAWWVGEGGAGEGLGGI